MTISIKKAVLWRRECNSRTSVLADTLKPLAAANADLKIIMFYTFPEPAGKCAVEVYPVTDARAEKAAREAGLVPSDDVHGILVEGADRQGLGHQIACSFDSKGIELRFAMVQVSGENFVGLFGFGSDEQAAAAAELIRETACDVIDEPTDEFITPAPADRMSPNVVPEQV
jgi:hypothetical protein